MDNPGGYLTLLPPINAANAVTGSPYFTENFGQPFKMWDGTITYNYMPKTWITWWGEVGYRHSNVPYWTGRKGITPPGGNTGSPGSYVCTNGATSGFPASLLRETASTQITQGTRLRPPVLLNLARAGPLGPPIWSETNPPLVWASWSGSKRTERNRGRCGGPGFFPYGKARTFQSSLIAQKYAFHG